MHLDSKTSKTTVTVRQWSVQRLNKCVKESCEFHPSVCRLLRQAPAAAAAAAGQALQATYVFQNFEKVLVIVMTHQDNDKHVTVVRNATDLQRLKLEKLMKNPVGALNWSVGYLISHVTEFDSVHFMWFIEWTSVSMLFQDFRCNTVPSSFSPWLIPPQLQPGRLGRVN